MNELIVDPERCVGHGKCYLTAPTLFAPDENDDWGRAEVLRPQIADDDVETLAAAREALSLCPEFAIRLTTTVSS